MTQSNSRSTIIETMARAVYAKNTWWRSLQPNDDGKGRYRQGLRAVEWDELYEIDRAGMIRDADVFLTAYESALEASGVAVVLGWRDIETADLELCSRAPCLVTADGCVGEARYYPDEDGWWWADYGPTDYLDRRCFPSHWMPLPPAALPPRSE